MKSLMSDPSPGMLIQPIWHSSAHLWSRPLPGGPSRGIPWTLEALTMLTGRSASARSSAFSSIHNCPSAAVSRGARVDSSP